MDLIRQYYWYFFVFVVGLSLFNIFFNLWELPIQEWDEARHGVNAYEMLKNGIWFANHYDGKPDFWNLKPPLGSWLISLSFSIFGINPFGLRFFSGLSAFLSILLIMLYAKSKYDEVTSVLSGIILSTCFSFIHVHGARTGDFDAIFTLLVLVAFILSELSNTNKYYIYASMFIFSMSFLLKSFASIIVGLLIASFFFMNRSYKKLNWYDYVLLPITAIIPVSVWVYGRYTFDGSVFFQKMFLYDLVERSTKAIEGHSSSIFFYLEPIFLKFLPWSLFFVIASIYGFFVLSKVYYKDGLTGIISLVKSRDWALVVYAISVLVPAFLVKTKTEWYVMPVFPALSIFIAKFLYLIPSRSKEFMSEGFTKLFNVVLITFFVIAETAILAQTLNPSLRVIQYKQGNLKDFVTETELQKIMYSGKIPEGAIVGIEGNITQSYYFLSKISGYKIVEIYKDSDLENVQYYITKCSNTNRFSTLYEKLHSYGAWCIVRIKSP
ncbi:MAG: glycosyltransferase family 39 protein [Brevinematales bacterium]|nr:glycosyltransferase family 39 protein [Brevinematales bacterium]